MNATLDRIAGTPEAWRTAATMIYRAGEQMIAAGKPVKVSLQEWEEDITARQRGFLHAAVLPQIAEQVRVNGTRYTAKVWKQFFKDLFIPDRWVMHRPPFVRDRKTGLLKPSTRSVPIKAKKSTEDFGIKAYSEFIDRVIAHAVTEFGVSFVFRVDEREAVRYRAPVRKARQQEAQPA